MAPLKHNWKLFEIIRAGRNIRDIQVSDSCLYLHGVYSLASIAECTAMMLALRSKEKAVLMGLSFALNIPVAELPDRLGEIPKDSVIATCCASCIRAVVFAVQVTLLGLLNHFLCLEYFYLCRYFHSNTGLYR